MDIKDYISSGIIELYVLDQLSPQERLEVENMAVKHVEIQQEIHAVSIALEKYAVGSGITMPQGLNDKIIESLPPKNNPLDATIKSTNTSSNYKHWAMLFGILGIGVALLYYQKNNAYNSLQKQFNKEKQYCDSLYQINQTELKFAAELRNINNIIVKIDATPKFASTLIYLHTNSKDGINYLQLQNLPPLAQGQAYQLWSLKSNIAPIPMDVFKDGKTFVKVGFEANSANYAITIENEAGAKAPNLDNLIGVFKVAG